MIQGPKGYIAQACEVHLQYGNSTTKWLFYTFFELIPFYTDLFSLILPHQPPPFLSFGNSGKNTPLLGKHGVVRIHFCSSINVSARKTVTGNFSSGLDLKIKWMVGAVG